jgi:hypothetical protein
MGRRTRGHGRDDERSERGSTDMHERTWMMVLLAGVLATGLALTGCGARTGLEVDPEDAGMDGGVLQGPDDAGTDAGVDAPPACVPGVVALEAGRTDVVFVIDRSGSMAATFEGAPPLPGELTRWEILESAMDDALGAFRGRSAIAVGAKFFPSRSSRTVDDSCAVLPGLDVPIGVGSAPGVVAGFARWDPAGGTPLAPALEEAILALDAVATERSAQFIVMATDGAPTCTSNAASASLDAIRRAHEERGIDVVVVGIASTAPEVALLDLMAETGGRPRRIGDSERRFYDARDPALLGSLLGEVTNDLARCVFAVPIPPRPDDEVEVLVGGEVVPSDPARSNGWDWTSESRAQLSLFGEACDRAIALDGDVRANITCR